MGREAMRHALTIIAVSAALAAAAVPATAAELQAPGGPGKVTVHHGARVEVVPAHAPAGTVVVHRGTVSRKPQPSEIDRLRGTLEKASQLRIAAGDDMVWVLDRDGRRLVSCRLRQTSTVGKDEIRCLKRKLRLSR